MRLTDAASTLRRTVPAPALFDPGSHSVPANVPIQLLMVGDRPLLAEDLRRFAAAGQVQLTVTGALPPSIAMLASATRPVVALIDLCTEADRGPRRRALLDLAGRFGAARIIALIGSDSSRDLHKLLSLDVGGIVDGDGDSMRIARAIRAVVAGCTYHDFRQQSVRVAGNGSELARSLSPREREVIRLLASGRTNREIGDALFIAETTAKSHVRMLLRKLGVRSRVELAYLAGRHGLS